jgi:hypothetical protein
MTVRGAALFPEILRLGAGTMGVSGLGASPESLESCIRGMTLVRFAA